VGNHINKLRGSARILLILAGLPLVLLWTVGCVSFSSETPASQSDASAAEPTPLLKTARAPKPASRSERPALSNSAVQRALRNAGLYDGAIDGILGGASGRSIRRFQAQHSLEVDGQPGSDTQDAMRPYLEMSPASPARPANH
jgi:peptidoglycan hydrolase-like protein with peptidoglycan-binding domain